MSQQNQPNSGGFSTPQRKIWEAHADSLDARRLYYQAENNPGQEDWLASAHAALHQTTMAYLETLLHDLRMKNIAEDWYEGEPSKDRAFLWSRRDTMAGPLPESEEWDEFAEELEARDDVEVLDVRYVTDEEDDEQSILLIVEIGTYGLRHLENHYRTRRTEETVRGGYRGKRRVEETTSTRLSPAVLFRAARALDEVASKLGYLPEANENLPEDTI